MNSQTQNAYEKPDVSAMTEDGPRCDGRIPGHNATYSFPCVRPLGHDGACNRAYVDGGASAMTEGVA